MNGCIEAGFLLPETFGSILKAFSCMVEVFK